jgi:hypothetical protein
MILARYGLNYVPFRGSLRVASGKPQGGFRVPTGRLPQGLRVLVITHKSGALRFARLFDKLAYHPEGGMALT